jgi:hypothetical protein
MLGLPATQQPYAYALNNPVLYSDPSGYFYLIDSMFNPDTPTPTPYPPTPTPIPTSGPTPTSTPWPPTSTSSATPWSTATYTHTPEPTHPTPTNYIPSYYTVTPGVPIESLIEPLVNSVVDVLKQFDLSEPSPLYPYDPLSPFENIPIPQIALFIKPARILLHVIMTGRHLLDCFDVSAPNNFSPTPIPTLGK